MFKKFTDHLRTKRAFRCVDQNDISGLLKFIDQGFNVNTCRVGETMTFSVDKKETVFSKALWNKNWEMLKALIEHVSPADKEEMIKSVRTGLFWSFDFFHRGQGSDSLRHDLSDKTHESSAKYFCLRHILTPETKAVSGVQESPVSHYEATISAFLEEDIAGISVKSRKALEKFLTNCDALDQKKLIEENLEGVMKEKPHSATKRKM